MMTPSAAAHKVSRAQTLVAVWSPWWHVYLSKCDFIYVYDDTVSITGSSSLVMTVGMEFVQSHNIMDISVCLEFALQQSLRSMDSRAERFIAHNPHVSHDVIGLSQSLEINDDMNKKFSSVASQSEWERIVSSVIDRSYIKTYDAQNPPEIPPGWMLPEDFGFESGLTAEKYARLFIEKNEKEEEEFLNRDDNDISDDDTSNDDTDTEESEKADSEDSDENSQPSEDTNNAQNDDNGAEDVDSKSHQESHEESAGKSQEGTDAQTSTGDKEEDNGKSHSDTKDTRSTQKSPDDSPISHHPSQTHGQDYHGGSSPMSSPSSPFTHVHPENIAAKNPAPHDENHSSLPSPVSSSPQEINSHDSQKNTRGSFTDDEKVGMDSDISTIEHNIASDYDNTPDRPQADNDNPVSYRQDDTPPSHDTIDNPWGGDKHPHNTAPQPSNESSPVSGQGADMVSIEASLADELDDSPKGTQNDIDNIQKDYQHLLDRVKNEVGQDGLHNFDIPRFHHNTGVSGLSSEERAELDKEIAESISEHQNSVAKNGGFTAGDSFIAWSHEKLRKPVVPWQKVLRRVVTLAVSRAQMTGQSDLSYAKQNPNQQPDMPIMMGFVTYPPEITVIVDASPSMLRRKNKIISEFVGVVQKILIQYSQPVVMAAADNSVKYVAYSTSPAHNIIKNIGKTFDGSSAKFGDTIARVARKGVKFRGRNYPEPDILIILTDCLFTWPLPDNSRLPLSYAKIIVASTEPYEDVKEYLPNWVKEKKNFLYVPD